MNNKSKFVFFSRASQFVPLSLAGLTAIEAWMLACILFVFGALVEYAAILFNRQAIPEEEVKIWQINSILI